MSLFAKKLLGVGVAVVALGVLIGLYVADWATSFPKTVAAKSAPPNSAGANLTLETVAAIGKKFSPSHPTGSPTWCAATASGCTAPIYTVPANSIVHVTIYQFDCPTGLRNPFLSQVQGTIGGTATFDGKTVNSIEPEEASHTFAVPELGVFVPLPGVPEEAKNPCEEAPCEPATSDTARSPSASARARRDATAGSASCRAAPASCSATAGRCRRWATWAASSMSSSESAPRSDLGGEPNHARRFGRSGCSPR